MMIMRCYTAAGWHTRFFRSKLLRRLRECRYGNGKEEVCVAVAQMSVVTKND